jgi:tetratricopeptide (TPR) repeat protein
MVKIGRNDPCPCGSGKKYKKCCLAKRPSRAPDLATVRADVERLDELSNAIVLRIRQGQLDEAERLCTQLARDYPDEIDPIERFAMLYEAQGNNANAAEYYRRAVEYAHTHEGFEPDLIDEWLSSARRLEAG